MNYFPLSLKHICDPFTRENNTTASGIPGTGLGMTIPKNLVDLMHRTIPIAAMTANAFAEDVQNAMEAGMNAHLTKPINMAALKGVLERLIHSERNS